MMGTLPGVLHVLHDGGGGVDFHVRQLVRRSAGSYRHWLLRAGNGAWRLTPCDAPDDPGGVILVRWGNPLTRLARSLGAEVLHIHHPVGAPVRLLRALERTSVPYGVTVHDFFWICPRLHLVRPGSGYCGAPEETSVCRACLAEPPVHRRSVKRWRRRHARILAGARFVACPTDYVRDLMARHFPGLPLITAPHAYRPGMTWQESPPEPAQPLTIAVLGALGPEKGGARVERLAELCRAYRLPIRWVVIGDTHRHGGPQALMDGHLVVHGGYRREDLPALLARYQASLVAFPAEGPETWSLTLDEAWACGLPAMVPDLGALEERVRATGAGWIVGDWRRDQAWLDQALALLTGHGRQGWRDACEYAARAAAEPQGPPPVTQLYERLLNRE